MIEVDKLAKCIRECLDIVENFYGDRTIKIRPDPEPEKPCKHEPILPVHYAVNGAVSIEAYQDLEKALIFPKCKCGAKLKMEGKWVEV
jgi:hypothetical protein